jgi:hypothetical protein
MEPVFCCLQRPHAADQRVHHSMTPPPLNAPRTNARKSKPALTVDGVQATLPLSATDEKPA